MADVYVNSWSEFLTEIATSGNVVHLPENAVWDMNEIAPSGVSGEIRIACSAIRGHGTRIKNLRLSGFFRVTAQYITINDLFLTDMIADRPSSSYPAVFWGNVFFVGCAISAIVSDGYYDLVRYTTNYDAYFAEKCSIYIEATNSNFSLYSMGSNGSKYCRLELHAPNSTNGSGLGKCLYCECVAYIPNAEVVSSSYFRGGCTVRGNMKQASESTWVGNWDAAVSVYDIDMFGDGYTPKYPQYFVACTDEQLKNPEYLRSKGFPIVVNGGG